MEVTKWETKQGQGKKQSSATPTPSSSSPSSYQSFETFQYPNVALTGIYGFSNAIYAENFVHIIPVQLVSNVRIPITVTAVIPINVDIQNAQICVDLDGTQTC